MFGMFPPGWRPKQEASADAGPAWYHVKCAACACGYMTLDGECPKHGELDKDGVPLKRSKG